MVAFVINLQQLIYPFYLSGKKFLLWYATSFVSLVNQSFFLLLPVLHWVFYKSIVTKYPCYFQKTLVMRMRIAYKMNGKDVLEEGQINNFPHNLWIWLIQRDVEDILHVPPFFSLLISGKLLPTICSDRANLLFKFLYPVGAV